jgi:hypothetical protein
MWYLCTIVGIANGSTLPLIIFCVFTSVFSCLFFTREPKAPPSSTLLFFLRAFLSEFVATFFLFSSVIYISSLIIKPWLVVFVDSPFDAQIDIERFLPILR